MTLFSTLPPGVTHWRGVARDPGLVAAIDDVVAGAPFRHMTTPRGAMSVAMTNCGALGWVSDDKGYRYDGLDPLTQTPWPALPDALFALAVDYASRAGFTRFTPDACLVNCYVPGAQMGLHQDRDESDFAQPIVSVSLGLPAVFVIGGTTRSQAKMEILLEHGDVVVFGGPARRMYHGIKKVARGHHPVLGERRINLTFRKAG